MDLDPLGTDGDRVFAHSYFISKSSGVAINKTWKAMAPF